MSARWRGYEKDFQQSCSFTWKSVSNWRHKNYADGLHNHLVTEGSQLMSRVSTFISDPFFPKSTAVVRWKQEWLLKVCSYLSLFSVKFCLFPFHAGDLERVLPDCHIPEIACLLNLYLAQIDRSWYFSNKVVVLEFGECCINWVHYGELWKSTQNPSISYASAPGCTFISDQ